MPVAKRMRRRLPVHRGGSTSPSAAAPLVPPPTVQPTTATTMDQPLVPGAPPMTSNAMLYGGLPVSPYPTIGEVPAAPMPGVPGAINNQNDLDAMISQVQRSQNLANQANAARYQQALAQMQAARQNLTGLYGRAGQYVQDIGQAAATDVGLGAQRTYGGLHQDLTSRGLGNSTVLASIARGVEDDRRRAMERVEEQRRVALGGLAERFAGAQFGATGDIAGLIQSRTDQGPDTGMYSQLARDAAATNTEKVKGFGGTVQNVPSNPYGSPPAGGGGGPSGGFSSSFGGGGVAGASAAGNHMSGGTYTGPKIPVRPQTRTAPGSARSTMSDQRPMTPGGIPVMSYQEYAASLGPGMAASLKKSAYQSYLRQKGVEQGGSPRSGAAVSTPAQPSLQQAMADSAMPAGAAVGSALGSAFGPAGGALGGLAGAALGGLYQKRVRSR